MQGCLEAQVGLVTGGTRGQKIPKVIREALDALRSSKGPRGKFKEVVAVANNSKGDCVRVTLEMSPDGHRYYMLDTTRDAIRIFAAKN